MQVRKLTLKKHRTRVVLWMRSGAPLTEGVQLYASLYPDAAFLSQLKTQPAVHRDKLYRVFCEMLGITYQKFTNIVNQYHEQKHTEEKQPNAPGSEKPKAKTTRSFRKDWPFLSKPDCPTELKALAADKISCWERYTAAHKQLFDCATPEDCYQAAFNVVENYKENRAIHAELEYYQQHGTVLGRHKVFDKFKRFKSLQGKNIVELVTLYQKTLPHRIWRIKSEIQKNDKPHLRGEREKRLNEAQAELAEVKRLLNIND